jgi:hypothetical protein
MRYDLGTVFKGSTHSGLPFPLWAMIEQFIEVFYTASSGERGSGLPSSRRQDTGAPSAPITTTPSLEDALATWAMTTIPPRTLAPRPDIGLPIERWHTFQEGE